MGKFIDLKDQKFSRLTVIERTHTDKYGKWHWLCECDCGKIITVNGCSLRGGSTKSCGCYSRYNTSKQKTANIKGQKFNKLEAIERKGKDKYGNYLWTCACDCGNKIQTTVSHLRSGNTQSCGCYQKQKVQEIFSKHNLKGTRIYTIYQNMKERCYNSNHPAYKYYGGKGVAIAQEWHSIEDFYQWALNNGYQDDLTIDRIDGTKNYCPENCRWIPMRDQAKNQTSNINITYRGETKILAEWASLLGMSPGALKYRITHWTLEKALTHPIKQRRK